MRLQVCGGDCAEVTLVTLKVILRGLAIGQDVATGQLFQLLQAPRKKVQAGGINTVFWFQFLLDYLFWCHLGSV